MVGHERGVTLVHDKRDDDVPGEVTAWARQTSQGDADTLLN